MASQPPYQYSPLPHKDSIRVLELHPGYHGDMISCTLHVLDYTKYSCAQYDYEAISYVWGDARDKTMVLCDGMGLQVTQNLSDVLRSVRHHDRSRQLWADAICINQSDNEEKAVQVAQMLRVYQNAKLVLVWLGQHDQHSKVAMPIFEKMYGIIQCGCLSPAKARNQEFFTGLDCHFKQLRNELKLNSIDWKSIGFFLSRPYFSRIWILQEASANLATVALCGDSQLPLIAITSIARCLCRSFQSEPEIARSCNFRGKGFYHASLLFTNFDDASLNLLELLQLGRECECSDQRDKLFALYGLLAPGHVRFHDTTRISLAPNYTETMQNIYLKIAIYSIQTTYSLGVLRYVHHASSISLERFSWVPRWDVWHVCPKFGLHEWAACGWRTVDLVPKDVSKHLRLRGVAFDVVREVHIYRGSSSWGDPPLGIAASWSSLFRGGHYLTGEQLASAFALTMAASFFSFGKSKGDAVQNAAQHFEAWLLHKGIGHLHAAGDDLGMIKQMNPSGDWKFFEDACEAGFLTRPCFVAEKGYLGLGPDLIQPGDICCVLFGREVPFILRPVDDYYLLVGESYIHGAMNGKVMDLMEAGKLQDRMFEIY